MDIEFSQIHEMVYMHDIVNSDSKKKPRNINNSLPLQPLVPDKENKNKKNEEKSVNPVKITMGSGLNYIEQESLGGKYLTHDLSIKIADIFEEIIQQAILSAMSIYKFSITDDLMSMVVNYNSMAFTLSFFIVEFNVVFERVRHIHIYTFFYHNCFSSSGFEL